jgi:4,5-DOPA dioxygenase extradiol
MWLPIRSSQVIVKARLIQMREEDVLSKPLPAIFLGHGNPMNTMTRYVWTETWAARFDIKAREVILRGDYKALVDYEKLGPHALLSIPTPDHYLPLLYVLGSIRQGEATTFPVDGFDGGSMSMLAVRAGNYEV